MIVEFSKLRPGGNDTAIVRTRVLEKLRVPIARSLMSTSYAGVEQVGYLSEERYSDCDGILEMMGGELCVNALRGAALLLSDDRTAERNVRIRCSGRKDPFLCNVRPIDDRASYVSFGLSWDIGVECLEKNIFLVTLGGISHFVYYSSERSKSALEIQFKELRSKYKERLGSVPACGMVEVCVTGAEIIMNPLVYVGATDSLIWETACGSGSIAAAVVERYSGGSSFASILQPSGITFDIAVSTMAKGWNIQLGSPVEFLVDGTAFIPESLEEGNRPVPLR